MISNRFKIVCFIFCTWLFASLFAVAAYGQTQVRINGPFGATWNVLLDGEVIPELELEATVDSILAGASPDADVTIDLDVAVTIVEPEPDPDPDPVPVGEMEALILAAAPEQHPTEARFTKIPGSEIDVLVQCEELDDWGQNIKCFNSDNAFTAWAGGAWNWDDWEMAQSAGGGHYDYGGNEVYVANLVSDNGALAVDWSRPIDPQPLTANSVTGTDLSNAENDCGAPRSGPVGSHTYASPIHISSLGVYWHSTSGGFPKTTDCNEISNDSAKGQWVHDKNSWQMVGDNEGAGWAYPSACYHRDADKIYLYTRAKARRHVIDVQTWTVEETQGGGWLSSSGQWDGTMDQARGICYFYAKGSGIRGDQYDSDGALLGRVFQSETRTLPVGSLSVEHSTGNVVVISTDGYVLHVDTATGVETDISATDGVGLTGTSRIYGKFEMIEPVPCTGIGMTDAREGVFLMTLPANVCTLQEPDPEPVVGNFLEQCAQPDVVFCDPLSTHGPYAVNDGELSVLTNPDGSEGIYHGSWWREWRGNQEKNEGRLARYDPEQDALMVLKTDANSNSGLFTTNFSKDLSVQFGEGDKFSVEFQVRYNCGYVYMDCDPESADYKTDLRPFPADGELQGSKIAIISEGDSVPGESAGACVRIQVVPILSKGAISAFHDCGRYAGITEMTGKVIGGSKQINSQPGGDYTCLRFPDDETPNRSSWDQGGTGPNCASIESDEWMTVKIVLDIVEWGERVNNFELWFAREGEALAKVIDQDIRIRPPDDRYIGYGKIWFQMHSTRADRDIGEPDKIAWYRNLIVSDLAQT